MTGLYVILGIIALLAVIVIGIYNGLVAKRQQCRQAFADVDVQLKQRREFPRKSAYSCLFGIQIAGEVSPIQQMMGSEAGH